MSCRKMIAGLLANLPTAKSKFMKNSNFFFLFLAFAALSACKEVPASIPELSVGDRKVLVEELTGVGCAQCPGGTAKLAALTEQYGDNLVIVSLHAAPNFSNPLPESKYDFRTQKGTELANYIGVAAGYPATAINRRLVPPETQIYLIGTSFWSGIIQEELVKPPQTGVFLNTQFDAVSRKLDVNVNIAPDATLTGEYRLTVLITQDSIQDYQKDGLEKIPDYYHRHVLRDILTLPTGNVIEEALTPAAVVTRHFSTTLPVEWKEKHCNVVAFVHRGATPDKEVLQVDEVHVVQ